MPSFALLALSTSSIASDPAEAVGADAYVQHAQHAIWTLDAGFSPVGGHSHPGVANCLKGAHNCNEGLTLAAAHGLLGMITQNSSDFTQTARLLSVYGQFWANNTRNGTKAFAAQWDFFQCDPLMSSYQALLRSNTTFLLSPLDARRIKNAAKSVCQPQMRGVFNQPLSRVAGTAKALSVWPNIAHNTTTVWHEYVDAVWDDWDSCRCYTENSPGPQSPNYTRAQIPHIMTHVLARRNTTFHDCLACLLY